MKYEFVSAAEDSRLDHVGSYRRRLPVTLDRMYENALDWQHLPFQHSSSFDSIDCISYGGWGWRARVTSGYGSEATTSVLELVLDRDARCWITRNLEGPSVGAEIWTHVFVVSERVLDIVVDFFVPDVAKAARDKVGMAYARAYELLYDEDVAMMTERQRQLDRRLDGINRAENIDLGPADSLVLPHQVTLSGRRFVLNRLTDEDSGLPADWVIYPAQCPHQLGPLDDVPLIAGTVRCPWHGYVFDVTSGACVSGSHCQFGEMPQVNACEDGVTLCWKPGP
jgi:hypothetical protein